jgi:hypothetical protein
MVSQMPSESSELYEAMRSYIAAALQLASKQCPERPPYLMPSSTNWKCASDQRFQVYDESIPYWVGCILSNRDALHSLDEYQRVLAVLPSTPDIAAQMDQVVGAGVEITTLEAHRITDRLIWSLAESTGGLHFDEQVFNRAMSTAVLANAVRRFSYACERDRPDDRLVDLMIAAESLFLGGESGPGNRGELSYRLSLRAAFFIDSRDYSPGLLRIALQKGINVASGTKGPLLDWNALIIPP